MGMGSKCLAAMDFLTTNGCGGETTALIWLIGMAFGMSLLPEADPGLSGSLAPNAEPGLSIAEMLLRPDGWLPRPDPGLNSFSCPLDPDVNLFKDPWMEDLDMDICLLSSLIAIVAPGWKRFVMLP